MLFFCLSVLLITYFFALVIIAYQFVGTGSDHYFHNFYVDIILKNKHKFFSKFENFIGNIHTTDPLLIYKIISYFPAKKRNYITLLLNPLIMTLMMFIWGIFFIKVTSFNVSIIITVFCLVAFTPQYYYAQNARLYGLSSRGLGLLIGLSTMISLYMATNISPYYWILALLFAYLSWISNLFVQQYLIIVSLLMLLIFHDYYFILLVISSLLLFFTLQNKIATQYFKNRWQYFLIYKNFLAKKFLLDYRFSIWRDWIYDFWRINNFKSASNWLSYIYNNSIFIVAVFNPNLIIVLITIINGKDVYIDENPLYSFSLKVSLCSLGAFIATSFRFSRFLGEPERYVEMAIPFMTIISVFALKNHFNYLYYLLGYCIFLTVFQIFFFLRMRKKLYPEDDAATPINIAQSIYSYAKNEDVRIASNCMEILKKLLNTKWQFLMYYPTVKELGGIHVKNLFSHYPFLTDESVIHLLGRNNINYLIINKKETLHLQNYEALIIYEDAKYIVFHL
jgi:hypothetical protein